MEMWLDMAEIALGSCALHPQSLTKKQKFRAQTSFGKLPSGQQLFSLPRSNSNRDSLLHCNLQVTLHSTVFDDLLLTIHSSYLPYPPSLSTFSNHFIFYLFSPQASQHHNTNRLCCGPKSSLLRPYLARSNHSRRLSLYTRSV